MPCRVSDLSPRVETLLSANKKMFTASLPAVAERHTAFLIVLSAFLLAFTTQLLSLAKLLLVFRLALLARLSCFKTISSGSAPTFFAFAHLFLLVNCPLFTAVFHPSTSLEAALFLLNFSDKVFQANTAFFKSVTSLNKILKEVYEGVVLFVATCAADVFTAVCFC